MAWYVCVGKDGEENAGGRMMHWNGVEGRQGIQASKVGSGIGGGKGEDGSEAMINSLRFHYED